MKVHDLYIADEPPSHPYDPSEWDRDLSPRQVMDRIALALVSNRVGDNLHIVIATRRA